MAELKDKLVTLEDLKEVYDNTVHTDDNHVTGVKGNAETGAYRTGDVILTPANIGAKAVQTGVGDPAASGTTTQFIATISQDTQGKISATKRTVTSASTTAAGLMSAADKQKLDNLTASSIGALPISGGTMTGTIRSASDLDYDNPPFSNKTSEILQALDVNNLVRMRIYQNVSNVGNKFLYLMARDDDGSGSMSDYSQLAIGLTPDGSPIFTLGSSKGNASAAFRKAISLGTSDGSLPIQISQGGTGLMASPSLLVNLASTSSANVMQASPRPGVTGSLPVGNGGTGGTTPAAARENLKAAQDLDLNFSQANATYNNIYKRLITEMQANKATPFYASQYAMAVLTGGSPGSANGKLNTSSKGIALKDANGRVSMIASTTVTSSQNHIFTIVVDSITTSGLNCAALYVYSGTSML